MIEIKIDIGDLIVVSQKIGKLPQIIDASLPRSLNKAGEDMKQRAIQILQENFESVPPDALAGSLTTIPPVPAARGHVTHVMTGSGYRLPYFTWITERDERVCNICGPRHGEIFSQEDLEDIFPAHPGCRCRVERLPVGGVLLDNRMKLIVPAVEAMDLINEIRKEFGTGSLPMKKTRSR